MEDIGYQSHHSILNLSTMYFVMNIYLLKIVCLVFLKFFALSTDGKFRSRQKAQSIFDKVFFGELISISLEGYMELIICGYLEMINPVESTGIERQSVYLGYFSFFLGLIILPSMLIWVVVQDK
jgi:hypothetical protein